MAVQRPGCAEGLPESLVGRADEYLGECQGALAGAEDSEGLTEEARKVFAYSDYVARHCSRYPELLQGLVESGDLFRGYQDGHYRQALATLLEPIRDEKVLAEALRRYRQREMVRIAWRDLSGRCGLDEVVADLSNLADTMVDLTLERLYQWHCEQWGVPYSPEGVQQQLVVLGMGKLGGQELNFSSDIDLIFSYPEDGETQGGRRATTNQEFFIRLGQRLIAAIDVVSAYGFVFRVDMRLRPFGNSGPLAVSFDAMEEYYQTHGREWERYALVKARTIAGDRQEGESLLKRLRPFVYRRYIDFGAFESLREMKAMINREVQRKGMELNVKLGPGGIREVEFIGQAFQLIRGGREPTLQSRKILTVLEALKGFELLPEYVVNELVDAYTFLRNTEHRLQEYGDQQTQQLPEEETHQLRIASAMGFADWGSFMVELQGQMGQVHGHFNQIFTAPQTGHSEVDENDLSGLWQGGMDESRAHQVLEGLGYRDSASSYQLLLGLYEGRTFQALSSNGQGRLEQLIPLLIGAVAGSPDPDLALQRLVELIVGIGRRSAYFALLVENPMALSQLVRLCAASPWVATQITRMPQLLDELLDPRTLYNPPPAEQLCNELRQRMLHLHADDLERQMDDLRHFKQANVLRVAAADLVDAVPLMRVGDHLTEIAEVVLESSFDTAWHSMVSRHGRPRSGGGVLDGSGFVAIAYGKMGGFELGYGSDLDLVFLHSSETMGYTTDGDKSLEPPVFYGRLAQRMIHILTSRTSAGVLYEIDTRLRPSGASGLMVAHLNSFNDYQLNRAWTWEHQALVRARVVCGDEAMATAFNAIRLKVLAQERDPQQLRGEVREMREKMRSHLLKCGDEEFDIKQGRGGIADIEFMVQYGVLTWAHRYPALVEYTDNIRQIEALGVAGLLAQDETQLLISAYKGYRGRSNRLALQERPAVVDSGEFAETQESVSTLWRQWMER